MDRFSSGVERAITSGTPRPLSTNVPTLKGSNYLRDKFDLSGSEPVSVPRPDVLLRSHPAIKFVAFQRLFISLFVVYLSFACRAFRGFFILTEIITIINIRKSLEL